MAQQLSQPDMHPAGALGITTRFQELSPTIRQVSHALLTHHQTKAQWIPFDLHVLSTPPAFVLSQNQTLHTKVESPTQAHKKIKKQRAKPHPTTKQSAASHKQTPTPHHPNRQHNMSILLAIKNPTKNHTPPHKQSAAFNQTTTYKNI